MQWNLQTEDELEEQSVGAITGGNWAEGNDAGHGGDSGDNVGLLVT
jgi:hypothetical protein